MARKIVLLDDDDGSHAIQLKAPPSLNENYEFSFPVDAPEMGQALIADGVGGSSFGAASGVSGLSFALSGTTPERWYFYPEANGGVAPVNKALVTNTFYAFPMLYSLAGRTINKLSFDCRTLAGGSVARCGIYRNISDTVLYPSTLVVDGGEHSTGTTGYKTTAVSLSLTPGLYWVVFLASGTPGLNAISLSLMSAILLGHPITQITTANYGQGWSIAQAYGALPANFPGTPATATILNAITDASAPFIAVHFA